MYILVARENISDKPEKITLSRIKEILKEENEQIFYFDRENSHKNMMSLVDSIESDGYNAYFKEVKYGLSDDEYIYELHAL